MVLKEGLSAYAALPKSILKLTQRVGSEGVAYIALKAGNKGAYLGYKLANTEIKLADVTAQQVFANIEWATKNGIILEKIEDVKYLDQAGKELKGTLELVKQEDGKLGVKVIDEIKIFKRVPYEDFIKTFTATEEQYRKIYQLWGQEKWDELYQYFKTNKINYDDGIKDVWPPFYGFKNLEQKVLGTNLNKKIFDRFQKNESLGGGYASPVPDNSTFTLQARALGVNYDDLQALGQNYYYFKFKIKNASPDLEFQYGQAAPWFEELGGATQIKSSKGFHQIPDELEILEKWKFENGQWKQLKLIDGIWK